MHIFYYPFITKFTSLFGTTISFTSSLVPNHFPAAVLARLKISSLEVSRATSISHLFLPFTVTAKTIESRVNTSSLISSFLSKF
jgi:hypothetical protein